MELDDDSFVPLRPIPSVRGDRARARERQIAGQVSRHRERGAKPPRPARGLSRADIVGAAITIADVEGAESVSMRRVARELGVGAMSLYWHVESKEELHQLMLERVQAEASAPEPTGDWRSDLRSYAFAARAALLRHPWAIDFLGSGPPSGPNDARNAERLLATLDGLGCSLDTCMWIAMTVGTYVMGAALREVQEIRWHRAMDETTATMDASEIEAMSAELAWTVHRSGRYPHIAAIIDSGIDPDSPESRQERFEFGLDCVLDGITSRIQHPTTPHAQHPTATAPPTSDPAAPAASPRPSPAAPQPAPAAPQPAPAGPNA
jgi:AcrR family transcriptional regulator